MTALIPLVLAASTVKSVGAVLAVIITLGVVVYALMNIRAGRDEVGSEIELAPNLKPYYDDDELETKKLDRVLTMGLAGLVIVGIGLPAYWLGEPGRHEGAVNNYERIFVDRGEELYTEGNQCITCHGSQGAGGTSSYTLLDDEANFVAQVQWLAPALNTALMRYDKEELYYIIDNGRAWTPMPGWGEGGDGPNTTQQIDDLIAYIESIQLTPEESQEAVEKELRTTLGLGENDPIDYTDLATGQALFNLGHESSFAGGAYACGRCHTRGWSIQSATAEPASADISQYVSYEDGAGAYGPPLRDLIPRMFASEEALATFISVGNERGESYGLSGGGDGGMPGFGDNPNTEEIPDDGMLSQEMIEAIARYVASLGTGSGPDEAALDSDLEDVPDAATADEEEG